MKYKGETHWITLGKSLTPGFQPKLPIRRWGTILLISKPRNGKTALAKDIVVKISKFRKCFIFDYNGEWTNHVVNFNFKSEQPDRMNDVFIAKDFTFKISEFNNPNAFVSMGFSQDACNFLAILVRDAYNYYKDNPIKFVKMCQQLPTKETFVQEFNAIFGTKLYSPINFASKISLLTHLNFIIENGYFWIGKKDRKNLIDFKDAWLRFNHVIVDLSLGEKNTDVNKAQAYAGAILNEIAPLHKMTKGFIVFEETSALAPNIDTSIAYVIPSSLAQIRDLVTTLPKQDVKIGRAHV